ncbi:MAG: Asp-tRNA(Asn)/Glu-tRNA(Gln) amidotransferase subunit GatB [Bacteroidetes bacterium]|nr:Asp-tRNA(Asn)/Glu-tRNA(Gln) amidotransferase subunit GatB [Bacteroidota bacterium]
MSDSIYDKYEAVIGLEIHSQLLTRSKAFCSDSTEYGLMPNMQTSVISLAHPGTLPMHNKRAIELAICMGLACNCQIREYNMYARKNYFYADLTKGYQITQDKTPICYEGFVDIELKEGQTKRINLERIHMEEDTGKSMHDQDLYNSLIDYNRAGTPLIEIVTKPDFRTGEEAYAFITLIRQMVRYLDICDGNMEEGSLRCDANVSVRLKGAEAYGTKVEVKNMNSMRNVQKAIDFEIKRQIDSIEAGIAVTQETRTFDALKNLTIVMRTKEGANDYRYFPEPDLLPLVVTQEWIDRIKAEMPSLPKDLIAKYIQEYKLSDYDARVITDFKETAAYFEHICAHTGNYKAAANWINGVIKSYMNEQGIDITQIPVSPAKIADLINVIDEGKLSNSAAAQHVFPVMVKHPERSPLEIATELNLIQESDASAIDPIIEEVLAKYPDKVLEYKAGKQSLIGLFVGEVMKLSKGKADPKMTNSLVRKKLEE